VIGGTVEAHRAHMTAKIFAAVKDQLYQRGYDAISLADIAEACGMSRTTMYNYFPDKAALVIAYALREIELFVARLDDQLGSLDDPVDQLRAYVRLQLDYFSDHHLPPGPTLRMLLPESSAHVVLAHVRELEARLQGIVAEGRARGQFVVPDLDATVALISACISRGSESDAPLAERIDVTAGFVLRAVGAGDRPA
jgi:AcrR family transcriptional regulator